MVLVNATIERPNNLTLLNLCPDWCRCNSNKRNRNHDARKERSQS